MFNGRQINTDHYKYGARILRPEQKTKKIIRFKHFREPSVYDNARAASILGSPMELYNNNDDDYILNVSGRRHIPVDSIDVNMTTQHFRMQKIMHSADKYENIIKIRRIIDASNDVKYVSVTNINGSFKKTIKEIFAVK